MTEQYIDYFLKISLESPVIVDVDGQSQLYHIPLTPGEEMEMSYNDALARQVASEMGDYDPIPAASIYFED